MHKLAEKMADCLKAKVEGMGIDNIEGAALEELGKWVDIIKDIACYDKDMRIIKAMDESEENEEKMKYIEEYEDYPEMEERRGYRGQPRSKTSGRYMKRGDGRRMGYDEPPYYHMNPTMYHEWDKTQEELDRDMDRLTHGRMYFTDTTTNTGSMHNANGMRDRREGRSGMMRRGYMEAKEMGKDKGEKMKELEEYMKSMAEDLTEAIEGASPEERTMAKQKLSVLVSKM